jgi:hypothetical protein
MLPTIVTADITDDDAALPNDTIHMNDQSLGDDNINHSSTSGAVTAPTSVMPTLGDTNSVSMNAFAGYAGDPVSWGQHAMDFSGVFNANGPPSWSWPASFNQPGKFDVRNGLTTPPKDDSPYAMTSSQAFGMEVDAVDPSETVSQQKKRTRKTSKEGTEKSGGKMGRKPRKNSKITPESDDLDGEEGEDKREKFLERNRVAASKCRQKKKAWTNDLEERARELTSQRHMLTTHVAMLRNELLELKCKCLEHTSCDCEQIREYLKNTVAALQPAPAALYQLKPGVRQESTASEVVSSADGNANSPYQSSRQTSYDADSTLDYLKIEDGMPTTLAQSLDPKLGGNGYKN